MSEQPEPAGREEAEPVELGRPTRDPGPGRRGGGEDRPDLDERQRRIAEERKSMGPPLQEGDERGDEPSRRGSADGPTDPV